MWKDVNVRRQKFNERRRSRVAFLRSLRDGKTCVRCGWNEHPEILQFHHKNPEEKEFDFSKGSIGNFSLKRIQKEVDKCELLCPNCHMWHHYQESKRIISAV